MLAPYGPPFLSLRPRPGAASGWITSFVPTVQAGAMSVHYELDTDHVVRIVIDRPERRNALDLVHFAELAAAWGRFNADPDAWVAIVTGVPGSFCSGADLRDFIPLAQRLTAEGRSEHRGIPLSVGTDAVLLTLEIYKPIIAAVDGPCLAGGMDLLGGTDIRLATPNATFGLPEPRRGLIADGGTTARLPRQIGWPAAMELLLTGRTVSAERALELGLLNEVVPAGQLRDRASRWAGEIAANAPLAVQATKEAVLRGLSAPNGLSGAYEIEARVGRRLLQTEDVTEGLSAFLEKRPPQWRGR
jgi:enoyl-CoA hydratase